MLKCRRTLAVLSLLSLLLGGMLLFVGIASAEVVGPCKVTFNGRDVATASTPSTAIAVDAKATVPASIESQDKITGHSVSLEFAGVPWVVTSGVDDSRSWMGQVDVHRYAKYGVGLYKVIGASTGPGACSGTGFVKVTGVFPLGTVAGAAAAGVTVVGAALVGASVASAGGAAGRSSPPTVGEDRGPGQAENYCDPDQPADPILGTIYKVNRCLASALPAMFMTVAVMVSGMGAPGAPGAMPRRVGFRPFVPILGILGGLLAGVGTLVLAQQFALVYPTRTVVIVWMAVSLVLGILLPWLGRLSAVRKVNRVLAARAAAAGSGAGGAAR